MEEIEDAVKRGLNVNCICDNQAQFSLCVNKRLRACAKHMAQKQEYVIHSNHTRDRHCKKAIEEAEAKGYEKGFQEGMRQSTNKPYYTEKEAEAKGYEKANKEWNEMFVDWKKKAYDKGRADALKIFRDIKIKEDVWEKNNKKFTKKQLIELAWIKLEFDKMFEEELKAQEKNE